jgi:hypothetical protein
MKALKLIKFLLGNGTLTDSEKEKYEDLNFGYNEFKEKFILKFQTQLEDDVIRLFDSFKLSIIDNTGEQMAWSIADVNGTLYAGASAEYIFKYGMSELEDSNSLYDDRYESIEIDLDNFDLNEFINIIGDYLQVDEEHYYYINLDLNKSKNDEKTETEIKLIDFLKNRMLDSYNQVYIKYTDDEEDM